ncbi:MAG: twitch domain-containing radical SAM protein [Pseudobdellovibrio sp.]
MTLKDNFCILPFIHVATDPSGEVRYCCKSEHILNEKSQPLNLTDDSLERAWNGPEQKTMRLQMLEGKKPEACKSCWREEDLGRYSKRMVENYKFRDPKYESRIEEARQNGGAVKSHPIYFDLRLGNLCNLKCRTCSPYFSSRWAAEAPNWQNDPLFSSLYSITNKNMSWYQSPKFKKDLDIILPAIEELYVTGGEPTLIPELFDFLQLCVATKHSRHIRLRISSNLVILKNEFLQLLGEFSEVFFSPSLDAVGARNDWLRSPSTWTQLVPNFDKIFSLKNKTRLSIEVNCTVSVFNVLYLHELTEFLKHKASEFAFPVTIQLSPLRDPSMMQPGLLPQALHEKALSGFKLIEKNSPDILRSENDLTSLVSILQAGPTDEKYIYENLRQLAHHTQTLDELRKEKFSEVFPELAMLFAPK